jgi:ADP-glucose pyrophosphorylase
MMKNGKVNEIGVTVNEDYIWDVFCELDERNQKFGSDSTAQALDYAIAENAESAWYALTDTYVVDFLSEDFWRRYHQHVKVNWIWQEVLASFGDKLLKWYFTEIFPNVSTEDKSSAVLHADVGRMEADTLKLFTVRIIDLIESSWNDKVSEDVQQKSFFIRTLYIIAAPNMMNLLRNSEEWTSRSANFDEDFWLHVVEFSYKSRASLPDVLELFLSSMPSARLPQVLQTLLANHKERDAEVVLSLVSKRAEFKDVPMEWLKGMFWDAQEETVEHSY